jgi:hypothetical protein
MRGPEDFSNIRPDQQAAPAANLTAAAQTVPLATSFGDSVVSLQISGTWVGTIVFEGSHDNGQTWQPISVLALPALSAASSATANGNWFFISGGYSAVRARASSWTSGGAVVQWVASTANAPVSEVVATTNPNGVTLVNGASPAGAGTVVGTAVLGLDPYTKALVYAVLQGATGGTLDVYIQSSLNGGAVGGWVDVAHFPQLAAAAGKIGYFLSLTRGDASGNAAAVAPIVVNIVDGTPVLAANFFIPSGFGNALRVVFVAGAGTSAGATQTIIALPSTQ